MCRAEEKKRRGCWQGTSWVVEIARGWNVNAATRPEMLALFWNGPVGEASITNEGVFMLPCLLENRGEWSCHGLARGCGAAAQPAGEASPAQPSPAQQPSQVDCPVQVQVQVQVQVPAPAESLETHHADQLGLAADARLHGP